jgi:hypothetical protein
MLSLLGTHVILHCHRKVMYQQPVNNNNNTNGTLDHAEHAETELDRTEAGISTTLPQGVVGETTKDDDNNKNRGGGSSSESMQTKAGVSTGVYYTMFFLLLVGLVLGLVSCFVDIYEVTNTRGTTEFVQSYSIRSIGYDIPSSSLYPDRLDIRFLQVMWFVLTIVLPVWSSVLWVIFFFGVSSSSYNVQYKVFLLAEMAFSWSCAEVFVVSTIFGVLQLPTFGNGLIESDCQFCFAVTSTILTPFALTVTGTILHVVCNLWLYRKAHKVLFQPPTSHQQQQPPSAAAPQQ